MTECSDCQKSGVLNDHLVVFYHIKESNDQLIIIDRNDIIQIFLDIREDMLTRSLYRSTICNRIYMRKSNDFAFLHGGLHAGCSGRLYTDDLDMRVQKLGKCGNTCCQSASSDRYKDIIYKRKLLYDFHCNGSLSCRNSRIVKRMDKGISFFFCQFQSISTGLIIDISLEDDFCAVALGALYLNKRCGRRHNNDCLCTKLVCCIGNTLCMVSCGCGDQTFSSFFFRKGADLVVCATDFICAGTLHILWFKKNLVSCQF